MRVYRKILDRSVAIHFRYILRVGAHFIKYLNRASTRNKRCTYTHTHASKLFQHCAHYCIDTTIMQQCDNFATPCVWYIYNSVAILSHHWTFTFCSRFVPMLHTSGTKREQTVNRNKTRTALTPRGVRSSYMFNTSILGGILKIYHVHH